ncbi:hypothetical protein [Nesterenkonia sp.]|uniref:hypothetical protein n=1 Tax=Nesterenkonia sp. TaxID=704201 RepID=UPI0026372EE9|nr:hypothetical protein [Nesterenkonia sp.]
MTLLGLILLSIGGGDLLRVLLPRRAGSLLRIVLLAGFSLVVLVAGGIRCSVPAWGILLGLVAAAFWFCTVRIGPPLPPHRLIRTPRVQAVLVIGFLLITAAAVLLAQLSGSAAAAAAHHTLGGLPLQTAVLGAGVAAFLGVSSNGLVRAALRQDGSHPWEQAASNAHQLKGGRWIGPLERITLTGLLVAGAYPVAAGLIAAKGIVRFPEIQADQANGNKAEYFLVGSFVSWTLAILAAGLLMAAQ